MLLGFKLQSQQQEEYASPPPAGAITGWCKGYRPLSLGIGYPGNELNTLKRSARDTASNVSNVKGSPVFHAKYELFLSKHVGFGLTLNYSNISYTGTYSINVAPNLNTSNVSWNTLAYCVRFNGHILYNRPIDIYFGADFGFRTDRFNILQASPPFKITGTTGSMEVSLGARYLYKGRMGAYLEGGLGRACIVQGGLVLNTKPRRG